MIEIWKDVVGLEKYAQVSNFGRIKTKDRYINNNGGTMLLRGKIRKGSDNGLGYIQYTFTIDGENIKKYEHVMVAEAFIENTFNLPQVNHKDHDKSNNNVENLEWVTNSDNLKKYHEFNGTEFKVKFCKCGNKIFRTSALCIKCNSENNRKVERPSKDELLKMIIEKTFVEIASIYGVSDNAVKKWCKNYGLPYRRKDLKLLR